MHKPTIRIYDNQFSHSKGGSFGTGDFNIPPTHFNYSWEPIKGVTLSGVEGKPAIAIITESMFKHLHTVTEPIKIALLLETRALIKWYEWIKMPENYQKFDMILTHHRDLLGVDSRFKYFPFGGSWIKLEDWKVYDKTKNISIIASGKKETVWQRARHEVIEKFAVKYGIDVYGRGYKPIDYKLDALKDYRYSIVIENEPIDAFFTEKIIDCFSTGTIPIYWGCPSIGDFFNEDALVKVSSVEDIEAILKANEGNDFGTRFYNEAKQDGRIQKSLETARNYRLPEDYIWENYLKGYF